MTQDAARQVRAKIDAIRNAAKSDDSLRQRVTEDFDAFLDLFPDLDPGVSIGTTPPSSRQTGVIHMCPWQTCQATRANVETR